MVSATPPSLLAVAALAANLAPAAEALQLTPKPPARPPKAWGSSRGGGGGGLPDTDRRQGSRTKPLRAYTVADHRNGNNNNNNWWSFLRIPDSLAELAPQFGAEDSLFSFEGGNAAGAATRPYMPNLEVEEAATRTAAHVVDASASLEKEQLLSEIDALTTTFEALQSSMDYKAELYEATITSYETKVTSLEEKNVALEEGLKALTVALERQEEQLKELRTKPEAPVAERGANDVSFLLQAEENVNVLEKDNEMLRRRVRALEVELSDVAFASRQKLTPAPPAAGVNSAIAQEETQEASAGMAVASSTNEAAAKPKAPSAPVPSHILQQRQLEQLQLEVEQYKEERSSVRKLFGLGVRRGMRKVGKALNLWNPGYNLLLWGELRGQGKVVV